jgi:signal transduction histidine kinase
MGISQTLAMFLLRSYRFSTKEVVIIHSKRTTKLFSLILILMFVLSTVSIASNTTTGEKIYTVRADNNYPPYEFLENGVPTGFNIDMINAVANAMNLKIVIKMGPWNEVRADLEEGRIDALAGMYFSEERDKLVDFSVPHVVVSQSIFVRKNSNIQTFDDLKGKEVIVQKNDVMDDYIRKQNIASQIITVENQEQALQLLASGKHDAALLSNLQTFYLMKKNNIDNVQSVGAPMLLQDYCFAVKEGDLKLLTQLNEGLSIIKTNGTYKQIYSKWFGVYEQQNISDQVIKIVRLYLVPVILVIGLLLLWTWSLKIQVNRKTSQLKQSYEDIQILNISLEQKVLERTAEIHAINQELRDFAYIVSHDMKAPLRGISQVAKWLSDDPNVTLSPENRELMDLLINRVHRMDNLINGILAYSKASRTTNLDNTIDLDDVLKRIIGAMAIPECVVIDVAPHMPVIFGNEVKIEEVFQNLIYNAVQHVSEVNGVINVGFEEELHDWKFWVKDNGIGIEEKYFNKIFGMFQTLEAKDNKESTGIGLTIVKKIVEIHDGKIWIESELGKGATFFFTIAKRSEHNEIQ